MSSFIRHGDLMLKCDGCGEIILLYKDQTDRLLIHDYIHEHGWKTIKRGMKWENICPDCLKALKEQKRNTWLKQEVSDG